MFNTLLNVLARILAFPFVLVALAVRFVLESIRGGGAGRQEEALRELQGSIQALEGRVAGIQGNVSGILQWSGGSLQAVAERLGEVSRSAQQMVEVGDDISSLQELLRPPRLRGFIGEVWLDQFLGQFLPAEIYQMQYSFSCGLKVDAIIRLRDWLVPVDSKFPLDNFRRLSGAATDDEEEHARRAFRRDVRNHIDAVARYILPDEGTFPFAFMYIPAENVYYEVLTGHEGVGETSGLVSYALDKRVIPVSPNTFFAYLQCVVLGLKGLHIEEHARQIIDHLGRLNQDFGRVQSEFVTLGTHISRAKTKYDDLDKSMGRFGDRLTLPLQAELPQLAPTDEAQTTDEE